MVTRHTIESPGSAGYDPTRLYIYIFFAQPIYYFRAFSFSFSLPRRNSDPGSLLSRLVPPLPTAVHAFNFLSRQYFSTSFSRLLASNRAYPSYKARSRRLVSIKTKIRIPPSTYSIEINRNQSKSIVINRNQS